jgi:hypothetical protein
MRVRFRRRTRGRAGPAVSGLPYDHRSPDFGRGVEFGLLFASIKHHRRAEMAVHADMAGQARRLAERYSLLFASSPHEHGGECSANTGERDCKDGQEWIDVTIGPPP